MNNRIREHVKRGIGVAVLLLAVLPGRIEAQTERLPFALWEKYEFSGLAEYELTFDTIQEEQFQDWKQWLKGLLTFENRGDANIYLAVSVALFDKEDNLLGASGHPFFEELVVEPGGWMTVNLDFHLGGYRPEDISYFLFALKESHEPLLPDPR